MSRNKGFDKDFKFLKAFINKVKNYVFELRHYGVDFLERESSGSILLSLIVFQKLPNVFKKELIHKINNNYPKLPDIFDNYSEIVKTLMKTVLTNKRDDNVKMGINFKTKNGKNEQSFKKHIEFSKSTLNE